MLTKEHANGITLESIQFKNIATKVAAFCMQKIKENSNVKKKLVRQSKNVQLAFLRLTRK